MNEDPKPPFFGKISGYIQIKEIMAFLENNPFPYRSARHYLKTIKQNEAGFLYDMSDWTPHFALAVTEDYDNVYLTKKHWIMISFFRFYMLEKGRIPYINVAVGALPLILNGQWDLIETKTFGQKERKSNRDDFYQLFPYGHQSICKYAGLPAPFI